MRNRLFAFLFLAVANSPLLAADAKPTDIASRQYDLVVVGGTPGGIACAVRAAREGLDVLLVQHNQHIGGMMANGLTQWDALYGGHRSPLFSELLRNIEEHYRKNYGEASDDFKKVKYGQHHYPLGTVEPSIAEREFLRLVNAEKSLTLLLGHYPTAVERDGALLKSVTLREYAGSKEITVKASMFADGTYEGDLAAVAKVPYRVGREGRDEYKEPHAGKVFTNMAKGPAPTAAVEGKLNIRPYGSKQGTIDPMSPYTADGCVQAYNTRFSVTNDPANRLPIPKPANYNRDEYVNYERKYIASPIGPNHKGHVNSPILPGENHAYPEADWPTREKITKRHLDFGLGLMWFLQNDESIPEATRAGHRQWGLPKDEFTDNEHVPYEMYVREARRIVGRHVFTEHDNSLAKDYGRTPIHADSVGITDWYMDSHSCTTESRPGFKYDGKLILTEESRPAQIPYRSLLPKGVDNLIVPVCLSCTHISWGAIRLEPVMMQVGESAGFAAAQAKKTGKTPADIDTNVLVRKLCDSKMLVSFFNDTDASKDDPAIAASQYLGTRGFFASYDAKLEKPLSLLIAKAFVYQLTVENLAESSKGISAPLNTNDPAAKQIEKSLKGTSERMTEISAQSIHVLAKSIATFEQLESLPSNIDRNPITIEKFVELLLEGREANSRRKVQEYIVGKKWNRGEPITRGQACVLIYELLK